MQGQAQSVSMKQGDKLHTWGINGRARLPEILKKMLLMPGDLEALWG
jgi:hypothetical protein